MNRLATLLATGFGIGWIPRAPGTAASFIALPFGWWLAFLGDWMGLFAGTVAATLIGIWATNRHGKRVQRHDPSECVIDEVAGQWCALLPLASTGRLASPAALVAAFVLFRFFDLVKPWPIAPLERLPGGIGVMMDDIAAGMISAALVGGAIYAGWI